MQSSLWNHFCLYKLQKGCPGALLASRRRKKHHWKASSPGPESFYITSLNQPISLRSRFRVDIVNPAAAKQTLKQFWRPPGRLQSVFGGRYRDSRVFLAAAMLTLESFWGRVVLVCYTGRGKIIQISRFESCRTLAAPPPADQPVRSANVRHSSQSGTRAPLGDHGRNSIMSQYED
ncbi:hypothetical protein PoB_006464400 [Plakobranchus ocellatus]|uniref:Uncharacterized protein n=1 Tax=Plakobranchus ocellatus TaxID=259542 RepID=A0AAV4D1P0_9GAST|nr:hypothetical protein PoB_006464400 [Plakobranchus ocellatus]